MAYKKLPLRVASTFEKDGDRWVKIERNPLIDGKFLHLEITDKKEDLSIPFTLVSGLKTDKGHFLVGSMSSQSVGTYFDAGFVTDGKPDPKKENDYLTDWKENGCLFLLPVTGNNTLECIASALIGCFAEIYEGFKSKASISDEEKSLIVEAITTQKSINEIIKTRKHWDKIGEFKTAFGQISPLLYFSEDDLIPKRGEPIPYPELEEDSEFPFNLKLKPITIPDIKQENRKRGGYGSSVTVNGYMPLSERVLSVQSCLEGELKPAFDCLWKHYQENTDKVNFALYLSGLDKNHTYTGKSQTVRVNNPSSDIIEPKELDSDDLLEDDEENEVIPDSYEFFGEFIKTFPKELNIIPSEAISQSIKEYDNGKNFSPDSVICLDSLKVILNFETDGKKYPELPVKKKLKFLGYTRHLFTYSANELRELANKLVF